MRPLVSILIPAFNAEKWIAATLRSALAQTWEPTEIIVVDDGSTDRTLSVSRRFESRRVRVVAQANRGAAAARNKALFLSQGDYIQWLDADDLLSADKVALQMKALDQGRTGRILLSSAWGRFMYRDDRAEFLPTALWRDLSPVEWLLRKLGRNLYMQTATWLTSRELTEAAGPWDTSLWYDDDGEYFCRVLLASSGVRFVTAAKVYYRVSGAGRLSNIGRSNRKIEALWRSMTLHIDYLRSLEDSERVRAACIAYLQTSLGVFYPERPDLVRKAVAEARKMGGELRIPPLSWKYSWIRPVFGYGLAKSARLALPQVRQSLAAAWDGLLFRLEDRDPAGHRGPRGSSNDSPSY